MLVALLFLTVVVALYVLWGRDWLKSQPWAVAFFAWVEPVEKALWLDSRTILWARFKMFLGLVLTAMVSLGTVDLSPVVDLVPEAYHALAKLGLNLLPMVLTLMGAADEKLRRDTTTPVEK